MASDTRERPGYRPPGDSTSSTTANSTVACDVVAYTFGRERVLGRRVTIPLTDPSAAAEALCAALGGRAIAARYVAQMLAELDPWRRAS